MKAINHYGRIKNLIITLFLIFCFFSSIAQDLYCDIHGFYKRSIKKAKLEHANSISDYIDGYATNWIKDYKSVEIMTTVNGKTKKATGSNETLNSEQKNLLISADAASDIITNVHYNYINSVTGKVQDKMISITLTLVPDVEASYTEGDQKMKKYLKANVLDKLQGLNTEDIQDSQAMFTINEEGEIINAKVIKSTGDSGIDLIMLNALRNMSKWKPAENSNGIKVRQDFKLSLGKDGC
jgi:TonB family protein